MTIHELFLQLAKRKDLKIEIECRPDSIELTVLNRTTGNLEWEFIKYEEVTNVEPQAFEVFFESQLTTLIQKVDLL